MRGLLQKKIPDFLRPCHPRQPLCKAVNSVRACLMSGLACTSYAINILFNQIFKTYAFGVGAQQVCIRAMMAFSAFSNDVRLATEPVWSICTVPLAFGTCALLPQSSNSYHACASSDSKIIVTEQTDPRSQPVAKGKLSLGDRSLRQTKISAP